MTEQPLDGLLVVAVEQAVAAPLCSARLVDAGARVIKIERPEGDFARRYDTAALGDSSYFAWINHGKESLVLDFRQTADAALLRRLLQRADVFVSNLAPGALERAGFGNDTVRGANPGLINCTITGYGSSPGVAHLKAYDLLVQAESALIAVSGAPGEPGRIGISLCDIGAGVTAYTGILEALLMRARTGQGSDVAVSLFDVAAEWMSVPLVHAETGAGAPQRVGLKHPSIAPYGAFPASDGTLTLVSIQNEREWHRLCNDVLQRPDMAADPRWNSNDLRVHNRNALESAICRITATMDVATLRRALADAAIAFGALNSVEELAKHAALRRREILSSGNRALCLPAHPVIHQGHSPQCQRVPRIDEHGEAIRQEFAAD